MIRRTGGARSAAAKAPDKQVEALHCPSRPHAKKYGSRRPPAALADHAEIDAVGDDRAPFESVVRLQIVKDDCAGRSDRHRARPWLAAGPAQERRTAEHTPVIGDRLAVRSDEERACRTGAAPQARRARSDRSSAHAERRVGRRRRRGVHSRHAAERLPDESCEHPDRLRRERGGQIPHRDAVDNGAPTSRRRGRRSRPRRRARRLRSPDASWRTASSTPPTVGANEELISAIACGTRAPASRSRLRAASRPPGALAGVHRRRSAEGAAGTLHRD